MFSESVSSYFWSATDILGGSLDFIDYHQHIRTLLFFNVLIEIFEENIEKSVKEDKAKMKHFSLSSKMRMTQIR